MEKKINDKYTVIYDGDHEPEYPLLEQLPELKSFLKNFAKFAKKIFDAKNIKILLENNTTIEIKKVN